MAFESNLLGELPDDFIRREETGRVITCIIPSAAILGDQDDVFMIFYCSL